MEEGSAGQAGLRSPAKQPEKRGELFLTKSGAVAGRGEGASLVVGSASSPAVFADFGTWSHFKGTVVPADPIRADSKLTNASSLRGKVRLKDLRECLTSSH